MKIKLRLSKKLKPHFWFNCFKLAPTPMLYVNMLGMCLDIRWRHNQDRMPEYLEYDTTDVKHLLMVDRVYIKPNNRPKGVYTVPLKISNSYGKECSSQNEAMEKYKNPIK